MQSSAARAEAELSRIGAEIACDALKAEGVRVVFGYGGGAILHFYDALHRDPDLEHVTVRHEQGAAHAAVGYARATGGVGVCVATSGPGVTNLVTGIMDAHLDSVPIVAIGGQVASPLIGKDAFQETDMLSITASITKHAFQPRSAAEIGPMFARAFEIARSGRPGPVYIDLPKDVLFEEAVWRPAESEAAPAFVAPSPLPEDVARAADLLERAERPILLLGGGAVTADCRSELIAFAEEADLPVVTTINAKGLFPESHPQALGMIGMYGRKAAVWALDTADVIVALGCRFTDRITGQVEAFALGKTIVHVDIDAYELGKNVPAAVPIQADARDALRALRAAYTAPSASGARTAWARATGGARAVCARCVPHEARGGLHPKHVMDALNAVLRSQDIVTTGVGQHQMFACHFLEFDEPRRLITSSGAGTMGYGVPAAMGAAKACPDARAFVVDGDGSFQMTSQELATLVQENLRVTTLVLDNAQLGMVRQWQDREYEGRWEAVRFDDRLGHPDFALLAQAYGMPARSATTFEELEAALAWATAHDGPSLVRVAIDPRSDNFPMMPAGRTFAEYGGNCVAEPGTFFSAAERREMTAFEGDPK